MPLTQADLEDVQADAMADDVAIDLEKMSLWSREDAVKYFESGGTEEPPPPIASYTAPYTNGSTPTGATPWLSAVAKEAAATKRVVVFSWTGNRGGQGSAHNIRRVPLNWAKELGGDYEVYEVTLPGRGTRMKDPLRTDVKALIGEMAEAIGCALEGGRPYVLVGFAFGAVLAYEVGRAIAAKSASEGPALLVAVSAEGPSWAGRAGKQHALALPAFIDVLKKKGGTEFILKDAGMTKMYVPVIQADLTLEEQYAPPSAGSVAAFPITAVAGTKPGRDQEKSMVLADAADLWCAATSAPYKLLTVGTDWYVLQEESGVRAVLGEVTSFMGAL